MKRFLFVSLLLALSAGVPVCAQTEGSADGQRPRLSAGGFADVELHTSSDNVREGFDLAELDLYVTASLSEQWSALTEVVAQREFRSAGRPPHNELELERLFVTYTRSDAFRLELGQIHTGIVRWNERESRSRILQTPIDVPAMARQPEDEGAWPLRMMGLWASGCSFGPLGLSYGAGIGAGPGRTRDRLASVGTGFSPATIVSFSMAPEAAPGLELAAAAYAQHLTTDAGRLRERDATLSVNYVNNGVEVRSEWGRMRHRSTGSGRSFETIGYYALISKRLPGSAERIRPYLLVDRLNVASDEDYLKGVRDESAWAAGLRFDLSRRFSLKGEYRSQRAAGSARDTMVGGQIGFSF